MPKVLITGATGLLGREIFRSFKKANWDVVGTGLTRTGAGVVRLDLLDHDAVKSLVEKEKPAFIIHSAAERQPDAVAADPTRAWSLNVEATGYLSSVAPSTPILYISTDYVFSGIPGESPYPETSPVDSNAVTTPPRPANEYGRLKLEGELKVLRRPAATSGIALGGVLRVPILYGPTTPLDGSSSQNQQGDASKKDYNESAVGILVEKVRQSAAGKEVTMDDWSRRFPTNTSDIGEATVRIAARWLALLTLAKDGDEQQQSDFQGAAADAWPTVLHFSAKQRYTKYEMCKILAGILDLDISGMKADKEGGNAAGGVQRPYDTQLAVGKLEALLGEELKTIDFKEWWTKELKG